MTVRKRGAKKTGQGVFREMTVRGFALDSIAQMPMVLLKDAEENHTLPIWFSTMEAVAIAAELINRDALAESGCADLMTTLFSKLRVELDRIAIEGMNGSLFESWVYFSASGEEIRVKVRACEAIVLALKHAMPIRVAEAVLAEASMLDLCDEEGLGGAAACRFVDLLESLDPKDMGKYPM
jgi:bifunctional DNase/RNase